MYELIFRMLIQHRIAIIPRHKAIATSASPPRNDKIRRFLDFLTITKFSKMSLRAERGNPYEGLNQSHWNHDKTMNASDCHVD